MSIINGSGVAHIAAETLRKAIPHAADHLGCTPADVSFADGLFLARDSNLTVGLEELVIRLAPAQGAHPYDMYHAYESAGATYPHGCHVVEIEVDPATCVAQIQRYTVVDDFGVIINPVTLRGQIHGGIAQGIGQALYEHAAFDDQAQLLAGSLMDYTLPRADHLPSIDVYFRGTPTRNNHLEIKGPGQAGAIGSTQAVISALCDALGVTHIDMPATPAAIWRALQAKQQGKAV
jgi:carbon-monoxide dehydrogenase large subunit